MLSRSGPLACHCCDSWTGTRYVTKINKNQAINHLSIFGTGLKVNSSRANEKGVSKGIKGIASKQGAEDQNSQNDY